MARPKSKVLSLQEEYLRTKNPKLIEDLYKCLTTLGTRINERERLLEDEDGVMDLATDICMRLMETEAPVISAHPSAYMRSAMFYRAKPSSREERSVPIDDLDLPSVQKEEGITYDEFCDSLLSRFDDQSESMKLAALVIRNRVPWRDIRRAIEDREFRTEFTERMKEIRNAVEEDMSSSGMCETV